MDKYEEFRQIYKQELGIEISYEEAKIKGRKMMKIMKQALQSMATENTTKKLSPKSKNKKNNGESNATK